MIEDPNDFLDVKIRLVRGESPILFKALESIESRPGSRTRTLYFRSLAEMGLMMQEERMRGREPGLSSRAAATLTRDVTSSVASAPAVQTAAAPALAATVTAAVVEPPTAPPPVSPPVPALPPAHTPAASTPVSPQARDDDRPPPRIANQGGSRRLLEGEDFV